MLAQRRRRWLNIQTTLVQRLVFAGYPSNFFGESAVTVIVDVTIYIESSVKSLLYSVLL